MKLLLLLMGLAFIGCGPKNAPTKSTPQTIALSRTVDEHPHPEIISLMAQESDGGVALRGDVNGDGCVDFYDFDDLYARMVRLDTTRFIVVENSDLNCDNVITARDWWDWISYAIDVLGGGFCPQDAELPCLPPGRLG